MELNIWIDRFSSSSDDRTVIDLLSGAFLHTKI